jgi:hypothetical protein
MEARGILRSLLGIMAVRVVTVDCITRPGLTHRVVMDRGTGRTGITENADVTVT